MYSHCTNADAAARHGSPVVPGLQESVLPAEPQSLGRKTHGPDAARTRHVQPANEHELSDQGALIAYAENHYFRPMHSLRP